MLARLAALTDDELRLPMASRGTAAGARYALLDRMERRGASHAEAFHD